MLLAHIELLACGFALSRQFGLARFVSLQLLSQSLQCLLVATGFLPAVFQFA